MNSALFPASRKSVGGVTLVEVLVVTCIIAIAAVLITGGIQSLKTRNQTAQCAANLRQLAMMIQLYSIDHDGFLPRVLGEPTPQGRPSWFNTLEEAGIFAVYGATGWSGKEQSIARCPAREHKAAHTKIKSSAGYYHYGMNNSPTGLDTASGPVKTVAITSPSKTFLVADSDAELWVGRIKGEAVKVNHAAYPHRDGINLAFADGHVEWHPKPLPEITSITDPPPFPWWGN